MRNTVGKVCFWSLQELGSARVGVPRNHQIQVCMLGGDRNLLCFRPVPLEFVSQISATDHFARSDHFPRFEGAGTTRYPYRMH